MADDSFYLDRMNSAEAKLHTAQAGNDRLKEKIRHIKEVFGAREKSDGSFEIDYQKFVDQLGRESALEVRQIIDQTYSIRGAAGEKPKMVMPVETRGAVTDPPPQAGGDPVLTMLQTMLQTIFERLEYLEGRL